MPSPQPRPIALKLLEGRGHGRDSGGRVVAEAKPFKRLPPDPPTWMTTEAKNEWKRIVPELSRLELTKQVDRASLTAYCECWSRFVAASRLVKRDGLLTKPGEHSQGIVRNPAVAIVEAASKELRAWANEFGLTPAAENKIGRKDAAGGDDEDPFD